MQYSGYSNIGIHFVEGKWYSFSIYNLVQLQDGCDYYILQDVNGFKHFMPAEYYVSYGLKIGDKIDCKVDRINCTGRLLLEPRNPFYNVGDKYLFEINNHTISDGKKSVQVWDNTGNCIQVPLSGNEKLKINLKNSILCTVKSIHKGKLFLEYCPESI